MTSDKEYKGKLHVFHEAKEWKKFFTIDELKVGDKFIFVTQRIGDTGYCKLECKVINAKYENCIFCPFAKFLCNGIGCNCIILKVVE